MPRVELKNGKIRAIESTWSGLSNGFTLLFEALILQMCKNMPINQIAKLFKITDYIIWSMLEKYIDKALGEISLDSLSAFAVDETSIKKSHNYISIYVDLIKRHWDGFIRWEESNINNGILEGLNPVIQAAKRKARCYKFPHFRVIVYLLTGKLDLSSINSNIPSNL